MNEKLSLHSEQFVSSVLHQTLFVAVSFRQLVAKAWWEAALLAELKIYIK